MCSTSGAFQRHLPSSHGVFSASFSLISLQILLSFGFAVKGEELCHAAPRDPAAALDFGELILCLGSLFSTHIPPCLGFAGTLISPWLGGWRSELIKGQ